MASGDGVRRPDGGLDYADAGPDAREPVPEFEDQPPCRLRADARDTDQAGLVLGLDGPDEVVDGDLGEDLEREGGADLAPIRRPKTSRSLGSKTP